MSDEHDTADGGDETGGGQTAVATPARPTGKRTRQRALTPDADDTESGAVELGSESNGAKNGKKPKRAKKSSDPSRNPFAFVWNYLKQVVAELRKVIWPNRKQMVTYTSVVLVFLAFMVALISGVDLGLAKLVLLVFG